MKQPKLRDSKHLHEVDYAINQIPENVVTQIGAGIVYLRYIGRRDMMGDDWGDIFAKAIGGNHLASPVGIADVEKGNIAWSLKTVKQNNPFGAKSVRLISGRCSPDYSFGIEDPHDDIQKTGEAVLAIWNSRVDIALSHYPHLRVNVLIRDYDLTNFVLFEEYLEHFNIADYEWVENSNSNLEGIERRTGLRKFVWQPHGAQFTILAPVPSSAVKFKVHHPHRVIQDEILEKIGFESSWIEII